MVGSVRSINWNITCCRRPPGYVWQLLWKERLKADFEAKKDLTKISGKKTDLYLVRLGVIHV